MPAWMVLLELVHCGFLLCLQWPVVLGDTRRDYRRHQRPYSPTVLTTGLSPHLEIYKNSVSPVQPILSIALLIWAGSLVSLLYVDYGVLGSLFSLLAVGFVMAGPRSSAGCMVSAWKLPADDRQLRAKAS